MTLWRLLFALCWLSCLGWAASGKWLSALVLALISWLYVSMARQMGLLGPHPSGKMPNRYD